MLFHFITKFTKFDNVLTYCVDFTVYLTSANIQMKKLISVISSVLLVVACSEPVKEDTAVKAPTLVKLGQVALVNEDNTFTFPAEVDAVKTIDLSFEVSGRLIQQDVITGQDVKEGHLLATIDQKPFVRRVKEQTSKLEQAKRDYERIKSMLAKGLTSQRDFDNAQTAFELAEIELNNSKQELSYTQLHAPFDAQIAERLVDNNSFVQAGQPIARIQDVSKIYFTINVPERVITVNTGRKIKQATATVGSLKQSFPVEYLEHSTTADPITQTYKAVFAMDPVAGTTLMPGARATLKIVIEHGEDEMVHVVPISALLGDESTGFYVWQYVESESTVKKVPVKAMRFNNDFVVIDSALSTQDSIVTAGANKMYKGLIVKPYVAEQ